MSVFRAPKTGRLRAAAITSGLALTIVIPTGAASAVPGYTTGVAEYVRLESGVAGTVEALINSGESPFGVTFEGIPDGIGVVPGKGDEEGDGQGADNRNDDGNDDANGNGKGKGGYVDLYVTHEQSHVPFGTTATNVFADYQDSSVTRLRVDVASRSITQMAVPLSPNLGFIRFCSAFMAGPDEGFPNYTFLVNEESNDVVPVLPGAPYGSDRSAGSGTRQAGYSAYLDTRTGVVAVLAGAGRHNHENQVVVPGWQSGIVSLSGDDTFTTTSSPTRPNLSQLYMYSAADASQFLADQGTLWAFRVTGTQAGPVNPADPQNNANDFFEIGVGNTFTGEFIPVPPDVARGTTNNLPQDALEDWSNANNAFQFIRIEDIAYDPDQPRVVYFTDTGNTRLLEAPNGQLYRAPAGTPGTSSSLGRVFKMVMNAADPTKVDAFSVLTEASTLGMRNPDNVAVGHDSLMVQEDVNNAKIWQYSLASGTWRHIASATQTEAETSGIVDVSDWFGPGWWALDVQSHINQKMDSGFLTWTGGPPPPGGNQYRLRREDGQLLLMHIANS